jgi:hypothetical protein
MSDPVAVLPTGPLLQALSHLPAQSLGQLSCVSRAWAQAMAQESLWQAQCKVGGPGEGQAPAIGSGRTTTHAHGNPGRCFTDAAALLGTQNLWSDKAYVPKELQQMASHQSCRQAWLLSQADAGRVTLTTEELTVFAWDVSSV